MTSTTITIRRAGAADDAALEDLAALDSRHVPTEPVLVAEVDGVLRAAVSLTDDAVVADPFVDTRSVVSLLATRAAQAHGTPQRRRSFVRPVLRAA
jgi:hypothetical protein